MSWLLRFHRRLSAPAHCAISFLIAGSLITPPPASFSNLTFFEFLLFFSSDHGLHFATFVFDVTFIACVNALLLHFNEHSAFLLAYFPRGCQVIAILAKIMFNRQKGFDESQFTTGGYFGDFAASEAETISNSAPLKFDWSFKMRSSSQLP
jgi:hypothetical protein